MTIRPRIDPARIGEEIFYSIFHHIFNDEGARKHFEFSQINFFNNTDGLPGWNLWFRENTRAYQLALVQAREIPDHHRSNHTSYLDAPAVEGRFVVRYFPGEDDPELDNFSCAETLLRMGPLFDHTGTPSLTGQGRIDISCFVVGYIDFRVGTGRNFVELECIAPNRWKDVRVDGLYLKTPENRELEAVAPGGIDRDVPGWKLAFFLFDKLISGYCYCFNATPCAAVFAEKKWVRFDLNRENSCKKIMDPDIDLFNLVTGLEIHNRRNGNNRRIPMNPDAYIHSVSERLSAEGFQLPKVWKEPDNQLKTEVNPLWWSVSKMKFAIDTEDEMHHCCYHDH